MTDTHEIDIYLSELRRHLGPVTLDEREEILREIQAHIRDAAEQDAPVGSVLARLGSPAELAAQYRDGLLISRASHSLSPVTLLRGAARMATRGLAGTIIFFAGLFGYTAGAGMVLGALLKPFFPDHVGVFASQTLSTKTLSVHDQVQHVTTYTSTPHEILGMWTIPLFLAVGSLTLLATTLLIRGVLRGARHVQIRLQA